jgi:hypothetical protein
MKADSASEQVSAVSTAFFTTNRHQTRENDDFIEDAAEDDCDNDADRNIDEEDFSNEHSIHDDDDDGIILNDSRYSQQVEDDDNYDISNSRHHYMDEEDGLNEDLELIEALEASSNFHNQEEEEMILNETQMEIVNRRIQMQNYSTISPPASTTRNRRY